MAGDARDRGGRNERFRTKPFDTGSAKLREALQQELRRAVAPSLAVILGPDVGARVPLQGSIEMGRDPACDLPLRDDNVSWRHARVEDRGNGDWVALDLGSTNGTMVNGQPCAGVALRPGDRLFLGTTVIELQQDALRDAHAAELERLISIDELSGLWVKRRFDTQLVSSVAAVRSGAVPALSVVVMDMDGVKAINDTHGHAMGAFVIGQAGHVIGRQVGARGFATRFGGDEFAAGLPGLGKQQALEVAEQVRVAVVAHVYERAGVRVHPGLSCGVATIPGDASDAEALLHAADEAMYRAKRAGKNRVSA